MPFLTSSLIDLRLLRIETFVIGVSRHDLEHNICVLKLEEGWLKATIIGASLSEPHINITVTCVRELYIYTCILCYVRHPRRATICIVCSARYIPKPA